LCCALGFITHRQQRFWDKSRLTEAFDEKAAQQYSIKSIPGAFNQLHYALVFTRSPLHRKRRFVDPTTRTPGYRDPTEPGLAGSWFSRGEDENGVSGSKPADYFRFQTGFAPEW
jgi:hypothetical protein